MGEQKGGSYTLRPCNQSGVDGLYIINKRHRSMSSMSTLLPSTLGLGLGLGYRLMGPGRFSQEEQYMSCIEKENDQMQR